MQKVICPYCGKRAEYVDSKEVYGGKSYGYIYLCRTCNAYVGVHDGTDKPLGRLADPELRRWKIAAHKAFDPMWKYGKFAGHRNDAYAWLSEQMELPRELTHFGMFDIDQCRKAIYIINNLKGAYYHGENKIREKSVGGGKLPAQNAVRDPG